MAKIRAAIVGVGNCASSLVQGVAYYRAANDNAVGLMHWNLGGYEPTDVEFVARLRHRRAQGRRRPRPGDLRQAQLHGGVRRGAARPASRCAWARCSTAWPTTWRACRPTAASCVADAPEPTRPRSSQALKDAARRGAGQLPAGRLGGRDPLLHGVRAGGGRRRGQLHAGVHRQRPGVGAALQGGAACRSSATTSRPSSAPPSSTAP